MVHNGDFANYFSICEYLAQRNIHPLFLTDTEVSVLTFDLLFRLYKYPLEFVIEALAPTTERDFTLLPTEKQKIYKYLQNTHMHGSPDGPWFFLIAQSIPSQRKPIYRLIGITDTSMLRPQVFALQKGEVPIGFAASEKQAIDATLKSLSKEDSRFWSCADYYWNARGGSYTDGGAFSFSVHREANGKATLECSNKFETSIHPSSLNPPYMPSKKSLSPFQPFPDLPTDKLDLWAKEQISSWDYEQFRGFLSALNSSATNDQNRKRAIAVMTALLDRRYPLSHMRRSSLRALVDTSLVELFESFARQPTPSYAYLSIESKKPILAGESQTLAINAHGYPSQGEQSLALEIVRMYKSGFMKFIVFNCQGQRFIGNGLGPNSHGVQIHVYGSSGDYLASGSDGIELIVHGNAQDQLAQIMKDGNLVVYGDLGQTFMYGAKGGTAFVLGNAAGRPMINAVGKPRVVINGTCLDYLAESFMAGNPLKGGGFVVLNGIGFDEEGKIVDLDTPYPGSNLFSLASGGAIYIRDPNEKVTKDQLNGGEFAQVTPEDWTLILPYLEKNAQLFDIPIDRLLEHQGTRENFQQIYRKIHPSRVRVLQEEEAWVKGKA